MTKDEAALLRRFLTDAHEYRPAKGERQREIGVRFVGCRMVAEGVIIKG